MFSENSRVICVIPGNVYVPGCVRAYVRACV